MAAAAANRVLDVPESQVAIDFFDDEVYHGIIGFYSFVALRGTGSRALLTMSWST